METNFKQPTAAQRIQRSESQGTEPTEAVFKSSVSWSRFVLAWWCHSYVTCGHTGDLCVETSPDSVDVWTGLRNTNRRCRSFNVHLSVWTRGHLTSFVERKMEEESTFPSLLHCLQSHGNSWEMNLQSGSVSTWEKSSRVPTQRHPQAESCTTTQEVTEQWKTQTENMKWGNLMGKRQLNTWPRADFNQS